MNFRRRRPKLRDDWREKDTCYKVGRRRVMQAKREPVEGVADRLYRAAYGDIDAEAAE